MKFIVTFLIALMICALALKISNSFLSGVMAGAFGVAVTVIVREEWQ
jgi:hypothetical protein